MNFRALEKSIWVLEKSWKFVSEKGYEPCSLDLLEYLVFDASLDFLADYQLVVGRGS